MKNTIEIIKNHKRLFSCVAFFGLLVFSLMITSLFPQKKPTSITLFPTPTPIAITNTQGDGIQKLSPYLHTQPGLPISSDVLSIPSLKKTSLSDEKTEYSFSSTNALHDNSVVTNNSNIVEFERAIPISEKFDHPKISFYTTTYGKPEQEITGSKTYGEVERFYIYASRGFTVVGNPFTDEVDEIQTFLPMTVKEYIKMWGTDIQELTEAPPRV